MNAAQLHAVAGFVAENIGAFHAARLHKLADVKLDALLKRCNPYLLKAKNLEVAHDFVKTLVDAHLSRAEQTIFGNFLEDLAVFVGEELYGARKSGIEGVDLEFVRDAVHYIVSIKSGPNWGNSSAVKKQAELFTKAAKVIRQSKRAKNVCAVLGCCSGRDNRPDKGNYYKYCGQEFWRFLSEDDRLYLDIVTPLGNEAKQRNDEFRLQYARLLNAITADFIAGFCTDGAIDWEALVKLNSARKEGR